MSLPGFGGRAGQNQAVTETEPAWRRRTEGEQRWWVALCVLAAVVLQTFVPSRFTLHHPRYLLQVFELLALVALVMSSPDRMSRRSRRSRVVGQVMLGLLAVSNFISVVLLVHEITTGGSKIPAGELLLGGGEIWLTNAIIFALWYWEYDRGGPTSRALGLAQVPDLQFPQMTDPELSKNWEPIFFDYLFVSYTNSTAFSPTDTMPLSRWCKALFMAQSAISLVTVALIAARAVNILPGS